MPVVTDVGCLGHFGEQNSMTPGCLLQRRLGRRQLIRKDENKVAGSHASIRRGDLKRTRRIIITVAHCDDTATTKPGVGATVISRPVTLTVMHSIAKLLLAPRRATDKLESHSQVKPKPPNCTERSPANWIASSLGLAIRQPTRLT